MNTVVKKIMRPALLILLLINFSFAVLSQQKMIFDHPEDLEIAQKAIQKIYNNEFKEGKEYAIKLKKDYEKHPAYTLLECISLYQKSVFDIDKDKEDPFYYSKLKLTLSHANTLYENSPNSDEAIFFELIIHSLLARYNNENKKFLNAAGEAKRSYKYIKKGYKRKESNSEFYLSSGLLDYYLVQYPEANPIVKPLVAAFFPKGNKEQGIDYFKKGAKKAVFTQPECYGYLNLVLLKYENRYEEGLKYTKEALDLYPKNTFNRCQYAEALLFTKDYQKAKKEIDQLFKSDIAFFKFVGYTLNGIYFEKYKKDYKTAYENYTKAVEIGERNVKVSFDYLSMAYNGLGRYYDHKNEEKSASSYYKKSLKIAEYVSVKTEAKAYLKKN